MEDGTLGQGGGLYLDNGLFNGAGLIIDAANSGGKSAFISGNGQINALVTMNGIVYAQVNTPNSTGSALWFNGPVTGSGQYFIEGGSTLWLNAGLFNSGGGNTVIFAGGADGSSLWIGTTDVTDNFQATIDQFGSNDDVDLLDIHGTSAVLNNATDVLSVLDAKGNTVATLQFDSSVTGDTFGVSSFGTDGGTQIRLADPNFAPLITGTNTGAITENAHPPVETITANLAFSDAVPGNLYSYTLKMEGDPPLGSLSVDPHVGPPLVLNGTVDNLPGSGGALGLNYAVSDSAINYLSAGETKTDTFDLELSDGHATYTEPYTVTITGTNEAPVIGNIDLSTTAFSTVGSASVSSALHPDDTTGGNLYNLLPDAASQPGSPVDALGQAGAIWQQVNLNENFSVHARLFFGTGVFNQFSSGGGDGITFTLQDEGSNVVGNPGNGIGVGSPEAPLNQPAIADAVGVKFDTYYNSEYVDGSMNPLELQQNFSQFFQNGNNEVPITGTQQLLTGNLDNGSWHDLVVNWNAATDTLTYTLDGSITNSLTQNLIANNFGGMSQVYLGFTGASGSAYSPEQVEVVSFSNGTQLSTDPTVYTGAVTADTPDTGTHCQWRLRARQFRWLDPRWRYAIRQCDKRRAESRRRTKLRIRGCIDCRLRHRYKSVATGRDRIRSRVRSQFRS